MARRIVFAALAVWLLLLDVGATRAELTVRGYSAPLHERFQNNSQFIGNPYNWSPVGRTTSGQWVTMVSPNYFLTALHAAPPLNSTVRLFETNSTSGNSMTATVLSGTQIAGTDLYLGRLDTATTYGIAKIAAMPVPSPNQELFLFGVGTNAEVTAQQRLGRNQVDLFVKNFQNSLLGPAVTDVIIYDYDTPTGGVGDDEATIQPNDSGAPTFIIYNGEPLLVGIHWFQYSQGTIPGMAPTGSGDSYVPSYINAINAAMIGEQLTVTAVPEPCSLMLVAASALLVPLRRWRQARRASCGESPAT